MENNLKVYNIEYCLETLREFRENRSLSTFNVGLRLGYLEACLQSYGKLETVENKEGTTEVKREVTKSDRWWKKDRRESYEEAIVRMTQKLIKELKTK